MHIEFTHQERPARPGRERASGRLVAAGLILAIVNGIFPLFVPALAVAVIIIVRGRIVVGAIAILLTLILPLIVYSGGVGGFAP